MPIQRAGKVVGYRPAAKVGLPDIMGYLPGGRGLGVEVKTGRDKLRPEQAAFIDQARKVGAAMLVVKDFEDFLEQLSTFYP